LIVPIFGSIFERSHLFEHRVDLLEDLVANEENVHGIEVGLVFQRRDTASRGNRSIGAERWICKLQMKAIY